MKTPARYKSLLIFAACTALPAAGLLAQEPAAASPRPATTPSVAVPADTTAAAPGGVAGAPGKGHGMKERLAALTPEERQELKAAHEKAMMDPTVKALEATKETDKRGYREAVHAAMLRADPNIQTVLDKMHEDRPGKKNF